MAEESDRKFSSGMENVINSSENLRKRQTTDQTANGHSEGTQDVHYSQIHTPVTYRNAQEYARALQPWLYHYQYMTQMHAFYSSMPFYMSCMSAASTPGAQSSTTNQVPAGNQRGAAREADLRRQNSSPQSTGQSVLYRVPTFWRRVAAELIDFTLLFYIKLLVTFIVIRKFGHVYDVIDYQELLNMEDIDYDKAFAITTEVIALEIINRLLITIFETMCLRHGIGTVGGATPGKRLLGLKLISGEHITDQGQGVVMVSPATDVGWARAFVRSSIKNFTIAFFLPACLTLFFYSHNRTIYDVLTKTIVVQNVDNRNQGR